MPDTEGGDGNPPVKVAPLPEDTLRYYVAGYDASFIFSSLPDTKGGDGNPPGFTANFPEDTLRYYVAGYDVFIINFPTRD